jgi:hypothetical protein
MCNSSYFFFRNTNARKSKESNSPISALTLRDPLIFTDYGIFSFQAKQERA